MSSSIILFDSVVTEGNLTASVADAGFPGAAAGNVFTYDWWQFSADQDASLFVDAGAAVEIDAVAFIAWGLIGATAELYSSSNGVDYTSRGYVELDREGPFLLVLDAPQTFRYWRLTFQTTSDLIASTGIVPVMFLGKALRFEKCVRGSHAPLPLNRVTDYITNESGTGQFLGRSIMRNNYRTQVQFDRMTAPWVRQSFQPFVRHARLKPYFFCWNYDLYPEDVGYVWTDDDIGAEYTGDRNRMSAQWNMKGLGPHEQI